MVRFWESTAAFTTSRSDSGRVGGCYRLATLCDPNQGRFRAGCGWSRRRTLFEDSTHAQGEPDRAGSGDRTDPRDGEDPPPTRRRGRCIRKAGEDELQVTFDQPQRAVLPAGGCVLRARCGHRRRLDRLTSGRSSDKQFVLWHAHSVAGLPTFAAEKELHARSQTLH